MRRLQLLAALAACALHYAPDSITAQAGDLLLRALGKGTAAATVELEGAVEAAAAAVQAAVRQLPGMQDAAPSVAWGILQRLLLGPDEASTSASIGVRPRVVQPASALKLRHIKGLCRLCCGCCGSPVQQARDAACHATCRAC